MLACHQWSLNTGLLIGAHDLKRLKLPVSLAISRGDETFQVLGSASRITLQAAHPSPFAADVHDARSLALPEAA